MDSSLERVRFSLRILSEMKGLRSCDGQVTVLSGACLFKRSERVEENCLKYESRVGAGLEKRSEDRMSLEKRLVLIDLMFRINLVTRGDLECEGTEKTEKTAY